MGYSHGVQQGGSDRPWRDSSRRLVAVDMNEDREGGKMIHGPQAHRL